MATMSIIRVVREIGKFSVGTPCALGSTAR